MKITQESVKLFTENELGRSLHELHMVDSWNNEQRNAYNILMEENLTRKGY